MSEHIKRMDGSYVLFLSKEEAEILGTLRFKHISTGVLYNALAGLPHIEGEFSVDCGDVPVFTEFRPGAHRYSDPFALRYVGTVTGRMVIPNAVPQSLPRPKWAVECNFGVEGVDKWLPSHNSRMEKLFDTEKDAMNAVRNAPWFNFRGHTGKYRAVPVDRITAAEVKRHRVVLPKPAEQPRKWDVQYNCAHTVSGQGDWVTLSRQPHLSQCLHAEGGYTSRNEAYRQLKLRAKQVGAPVTHYRVVPASTPNGAEMDLGYYTVQFLYKGGWLETAGGPGFHNRPENGRYHDSKTASEDIVNWGSRCNTYRVKWHPSNAS